jgi:autotransporter-associated beta strand protein
LTGNNTYSGGTTVSAGTLQIGDGGTNGSVTGDIANNAELRFNRSDALSYGGVISGTGSLTQAGAGTLILSGDNTYNGVTTVSAGTLQIGDGGTSGSVTGDIFNNAELRFNRSDALTYGGVISGAGNLTQAGAGTLTLTGTNTYSGGTTVSTGTLAGNIAANTNLTVAGGATYEDGGAARSVNALNGAGDITNGNGLSVQSGAFSGLISGAGSLSKGGAGTLILSGNNTYNGGTSVSAGTLQIGNGGTNGSVTGDIANNAELRFNRSDALSYGGVISGAGSLTQAGAETLILSGNNTYSGGTTVSAGGLTVGGTLGNGSYAGAIANNGSLTFDQSAPQTLSGAITGTGTLTKSGAGTLSLNENASQGAVKLNEGRLNVAAGKTLTATGAVTVADNTTLGLALGGSLPSINAASFSIGSTNTVLDITGYTDGTPAIIRSTGGAISGDFSALSIAGAAQTPSLDSFMEVAAEKVSNGSGEDLRITSTLAWNKASDAHGTFNIASGSFDLGANLADNSQSGAGATFGWDGSSLTKTGAGTLTLSGTNTFTGLLSIDAGGLTLGARGSLATSALSLGANTVFDHAAAAYTFHNLAVRGQGARISPDAGGADFSGADLAYLVPQTAANGAALLTVQGGAAIDAYTAVSLAYASGRTNISVGESFILLDAATLANNGFTQLTVQTASGDIYTLNVSGNQLAAALHQLSPTSPTYERLKAYSESRAANLAFANQGLDFILNRGFGSALAATSGQGFRFGSFGGLGGGWSRYNTGSHVDVSGMSLLAGLALGNDIAGGRVTLGTFFEGGWGNYTSHNSFSASASVGGKGDTSYYGGGVLGRYDLTEGALSGLYFDASARMGRAETDFRTGDIQYNGWKSGFDSSALYYGLHGGFGYVWLIPGLDNRGSLDLSAKLLWTRQEGDSLTVYQDRLRFQDADSLRTRLGGRFTYTVNEYVAPYAGVYWEHEFDGKLRASVNGQSLSSPSLEGDTGMGEFGFSLKPSQTLPLSFDLGVQGYTGMREGVTGSLQIKFEF